MPDVNRTQPLKMIGVSLFAALLLWHLGTGNTPASAFQDPFTPTNALKDTATPTNLSFTETPVATATPADSSLNPETDPSGTLPPMDEDGTAVADRLPLPAVFARGAHVQNELVVRFKPSTSGNRIDECFQGIDIQVRSEIEELRTFVLVIASGETSRAFYHVLDCAGVLYVEPNFLLQAADTIPNDPSWGVQYGLVNIRAPQGWDLSTGSPSVTIAIVDSGVDQGHPDLAGKLVAGYDFVNNDADPQDDNGHGTHVAGIAAASSNNGAGIAGVSWGARIMPVKVLNDSGGGTFANTAAGIIWAADHGARVINLSLGADADSQILQDAIGYARSRGAVVVAAAGNSGSNFVLYPARHPNVIAVARTNQANNWDGSNYGPEIDLAAPGASIYSTVIGGYDYKSGSSMSTGFVSGLAAILMGVPGNTSADLIEFQMESTALDIEFAGWDEYTGAGLIQMDAAIALALQSGHPPASPTQPFAGSGSVQVGLTNIPSPTWTISSTLPSPSSTNTPTTIASPGIPVHTMASIPAMEDRNEVEAQGPAADSNVFLPCIGIFLIVLGVTLLILFFHVSKDPPR